MLGRVCDWRYREKMTVSRDMAHLFAMSANGRGPGVFNFHIDKGAIHSAYFNNLGKHN